MNLTLRYTARNIKCNKLRVWMISLSTFIATIVFFFAFVLPTLVTTVKEDSMRSFYGSSDIYIMPNLNSSIELDLIGNIQMKNFYNDAEAVKMFDYSASFLALPGDISNDGAFILFGEISDVNKFNPIVFYSEEVEKLGRDEVLINRAYAEEKNLTVGSPVSLYVLGAEANFKVGAIAENKGLFAGINKEIILASKAALGRTQDSPEEPYRNGPFYRFFGFLGTGINASPYYFDIALFKVKEGVSVDDAVAKLETLYPKLDVNQTVDINLIDDTINSIMPLFIMGVVIICLFCAFVLYFISNLTVRDRATEFARMKCMGARNWQLITSIILETFFYAIIGSVLGMGLSIGILALATPSAISAIKIQYFIYPFLCSLGLSLIGLLFQSKRFFGSIRQSIVNSEKWSVFKKCFSVLCVLINIAAFISIFLIPQGQPVATIAVYALLILTSVYLTPIYFTAICWILHRIFKLKTFQSMYIRNSSATSHSPWLMRAITFGAITIFLLSTMDSTFKNYTTELNSTSDYNIQISGATGTYGPNLPTYFGTIDGVKKAYAGTLISGATIDNDGIKETTIYSYSDEDAQWLYQNYADAEVFETIKGKKQVLVGSYFRNVLDYKIGDKIIINFDRTEEGSNHEFVIAGFIENVKVAKSIIADINEVNAITGVVGYNNLFISAEEDKIDSIIENIKANCLPQNPTLLSSAPKIMLDNVHRSSTKTMNMFTTPFVAITVLVVAILIVCFVTNFMAFFVFLKQIKNRYFIFNTMGLSTSYLSTLLARQLLAYSFIGVILASLVTIPLPIQSDNLLSLSKMTMSISPDTISLLIIGLSYCCAYVVFSRICVPIMGKKLMKNTSYQIKLGQEKRERKDALTTSLAPKEDE